MSTTDYVVDILLIVVIFRQLRPRPYTARTAILPLLIVVWAGQHYLHGFHLAGNDALLITVFTAIGLALGAASAATTQMWSDDAGSILGKVGVWACATWIVGMGFRFAFAVYANTSSGDAAIGRFSRHHDITSGQAWTTALVFMAFAEVILRVIVLQVRRVRLESVRPTVSDVSLPEQRSGVAALSSRFRLPVLARRRGD